MTLGCTLVEVVHLSCIKIRLQFCYMASRKNIKATTTTRIKEFLGQHCQISVEVQAMSGAAAAV